MKKPSTKTDKAIKNAPPELMKRVLDDALEHGYVFRSMRAIADTSGVSHRMLIYHFGGQYGLWASIIKEVRSGESELFSSEIMLVESAEDLKQFFIDFWKRYTSDNFRAFYQLHFETYSYALRHPDECLDFLDGVVEPWLDLLSKLFHKVGFTAMESEHRARIMLAAMRGFTLDFLTTGDLDKIEESGRALLDLVCYK